MLIKDQFKIKLIFALFPVSIIFILFCLSNSNNSQAMINSSKKAKPIPGRFIVTFYQSRNESNKVYMLDKEIKSTFLKQSEIDNLLSMGLRKASIVYQRNEKALCLFNFEPYSTSDIQIMSALKALPNVEHVQRDYPIKFHSEPNDFYYGPDSLSWNEHFVADSMNIMSENCNVTGGKGRWCKNTDPFYDWDDCCPDEYYYYSDNWYRDALHLSDNWYLQFTQANKAWDIQKGNPDVKIMVMDSGVDDEHPDLIANLWTNYDDTPGDDENNGLPGSSSDDDGDGHPNYCDLSYVSLDLDKDGYLIWGVNDSCDAGPDGDYGFGPNAIDDYPPGPGGGDDDTSSVGYDVWDDNTRGPGSLNPSLPFDDDFEDVQFIKLDDDENGYPDDYHGVNCYNPVDDWHEPGNSSDGIPGLKGWDDDVGGVDRDNNGIHFNDYEVNLADFDGDGTLLCGDDFICDAGSDGDYGFGPNAIDDYPPGPGGGDDDTSCVGYDPWDDNLRGPGSLDPALPFDDDMDDVYYLRFDDEEDGNPLLPAIDECCPKTTASHGTNMAGIISAVTNNSIGMAGYTWYCKLVPAKIATGFPEHPYENLNDKEGAVESIYKAIYYAIGLPLVL